MSVYEATTTAVADASVARGLSLRAPVDRRCPACDEVALVYDTEADTARCRACGELDDCSRRS